MFSGIVEEVGTVTAFDTDSGRLVVSASTVLDGEDGLRVSESVSVSGACLTVTATDIGEFTVEVSPETIRRTWFSHLTAGSQVNLERALKYGQRVGGHMVQGHIDAIGQIADIRPDGDAKLVRIEGPAEIIRYAVEKGFIAVDGVSLTCFDCTATDFTFTMIPYTASHTTLGALKLGVSVNIEADLTAKYIERLIPR